MSSARSMASRALDLKLAPSHDAHQKPPASTLDGKLMSPREEREGSSRAVIAVDLNGTSTASTCPPSNVSTAVCCGPVVVNDDDEGLETHSVVVHRQYSATTHQVG